MIKNYGVFILVCLLAMYSRPLMAERPDHDEYNERTSYLISKIQMITDADRIEALKHAYDQEIKDFCLDNNYKEEDIRNVLKR